MQIGTNNGERLNGQGSDADFALHSWQLRLAQRNPECIELGLERITSMVRRLGLKPAAGRVRVLTVAGTNGKGSSAQLAARLLIAQGYRVGLYTSPHLHSLTERFQINASSVQPQVLTDVFDWLSRQPEQETLTYFEFLTLAAFAVFNREDCDVWVLEVGLGGRLDAVNSIDPDLALITPIGLDHQAFLGDSRAQIGREKAGILRRGQPAVYNDPQPLASVQHQAELIGADLLVRGHDFHLQVDGEQACFIGPEREIRLPRFKQAPALLRDNAAGVLALFTHPNSGYQIDESLVARAWQDLQLPGRQQWCWHQQRRVLLDVGHNHQALTALADCLAASPKVNAITGKPKKRGFLFAAMRDKALVDMLEPVAKFADHWALAALPQPRAADTATLADAVLQHSNAPVSYESSVIDAYNRLLAQSQPGDEIIVFGSFFTVGPVAAHLSADQAQ